ncbi:hypothetical protein [Tautonia plasticadhaerens]|uniref:Uncharacterized protein n=1 Tax=Tautonia plasticadhaerens TaxID=2527974 RepID=A0A518HFR9_9BACT|nr:hypothetical protein [Tautonia plasticadhaerens]QDV39683.1 hypothetical protein ElP_76550 [Tautonia plasticadhaerens]
MDITLDQLRAWLLGRADSPTSAAIGEALDREDRRLAALFVRVGDLGESRGGRPPDGVLDAARTGDRMACDHLVRLRSQVGRLGEPWGREEALFEMARAEDRAAWERVCRACLPWAYRVELRRLGPGGWRPPELAELTEEILADLPGPVEAMQLPSLWALRSLLRVLIARRLSEIWRRKNRAPRSARM